MEIWVTKYIFKNQLSGLDKCNISQYMTTIRKMRIHYIPSFIKEAVDAVESTNTLSIIWIYKFSLSRSATYLTFLSNLKLESKSHCREESKLSNVFLFTLFIFNKSFYPTLLLAHFRGYRNEILTWNYLKLVTVNISKSSRKNVKNKGCIFPKINSATVNFWRLLHNCQNNFQAQTPHKLRKYLNNKTSEFTKNLSEFDILW